MLTAFWITLATAHIGAAAAASLHVLFFYQRPAAAVAWLFALWGLPLIGPLAYLCLALVPGRPSVRSKRREAAELRRGRLREGDVSDAYSGGLAAAGFAHLTQQVCSLPLTRGNRVELIEDDGEALQRQLAAIASARHEVLLQTYVLKPGRVQERLFEALAGHAADDVGVRLLIDPIGSQDLPHRLLAAIRAKGVATHTFLRPDPLKGRFQINYRNHRKILCVDGAVAFTGGRNWSD
jgi:cardiolipin synthase